MRDEVAFEASDQGYLDCGLERHPAKAKRGVDCATFWGVELEGRHGLAGPPRHKLAALLVLSAAESSAQAAAVVEVRASVVPAVVARARNSASLRMAPPSTRRGGCACPPDGVTRGVAQLCASVVCVRAHTHTCVCARVRTQV